MEVPSYVKYVPKDFKLVINGTTTNSTEKKFKGFRGGDEDGDFVKIEAKKKGQRWDRASIFIIRVNIGEEEAQEKGNDEVLR